MNTAGSRIGPKFAALTGLLGKNVEDSASRAFFAATPNVIVPKPKDGQQYVTCKPMGFCLLFEPKDMVANPNAKRLLTAIFLYPDNDEGYKTFSERPFGFDLMLDRAKLIAAVGKPNSTFKIREGNVAVDHPDPTHDTWIIEGLSINIRYKGGKPVCATIRSA